MKHVVYITLSYLHTICDPARKFWSLKRDKASTVVLIAEIIIQRVMIRDYPGTSIGGHPGDMGVKRKLPLMIRVCRELELFDSLLQENCLGLTLGLMEHASLQQLI